MLRCDEDNQHVHGGYAEETDPSSNVKDLDEDESEEIIVHEPLLENIQNLQWLTMDQVILTYSSAVEIYRINWMLRINVNSQHHQYNKDYIKHLQHERDTMIWWQITLKKRMSEVKEL